MKHILITGGNSGIGLATAKQLLKQDGLSVIITGSNPHKMKTALEQLGENAYGIIADNSNLSDIKMLKDKVTEICPLLDGLFINAGICQFSSILDTTEEQFDTQMMINFKSAFFTLQTLIPYLNIDSSIVLTSSIVTQKAFANTGIYSASKAALESIAQVLNVELAEQRIRVNLLVPGVTLTSVFERAGMSEQDINHLTQNQDTLLGRIIQADEIANAACFLLSDHSIAMRNARLVIDGGYTV